MVGDEKAVSQIDLVRLVGDEGFEALGKLEMAHGVFALEGVEVLARFRQKADCDLSGARG